MKKYIYGKYDTDTFPVEQTNYFQDLCVFFGAYLIFKERKSEFDSFANFVKENELTSVDNTCNYWAFINKAQMFIRNSINSNLNTNKKYLLISRRQIKKLGFSGKYCVPAFPMKGNEIQNELFKHMFSEQEFEEVKKYFIIHIFNKWKNTPTKFECCVGDTANSKNNIATKFCGFQYYVLREHFDIMKEFFDNKTYMDIKLELEALIRYDKELI